LETRSSPYSRDSAGLSGLPRNAPGCTRSDRGARTVGSDVETLGDASRGILAHPVPVESRVETGGDRGRPGEGATKNPGGCPGLGWSIGLGLDGFEEGGLRESAISLVIEVVQFVPNMMSVPGPVERAGANPEFACYRADVSFGDDPALRRDFDYDVIHVYDSLNGYPREGCPPGADGVVGHFARCPATRPSARTSTGTTSPSAAPAAGMVACRPNA
jgi:hypothetical protein